MHNPTRDLTHPSQGGGGRGGLQVMGGYRPSGTPGAAAPAKGNGRLLA